MPYTLMPYVSMPYTLLHIYNILIKIFTNQIVVPNTSICFFAFFLDLTFVFVNAFGTKSIAYFINICPSFEFPVVLVRLKTEKRRDSDSSRPLLACFLLFLCLLGPIFFLRFALLLQFAAVDFKKSLRI